MMEEKENKPTCKDFAEYLKKCAEAYAKHGSQELTNSDGEYQDIFDDLCQLHGDFDHGANRIISLKDMFIEYFNVNAARKSKVDDNTARMQSIKQLGV